MREGSKKILSRLPGAWEIARKTEEHAKGMLVPGTLFEELGWNYIGPIDGHDLPTLLATLRNMRDLEGPQFLHVVTKKGKGFAPAEIDPIGYHAITKLEAINAPAAQPKQASGPKYSSVFGQWLCDMAAQDPRLVGITPAMKEGSDLVAFSERYPERYLDVAIAEQHAVTLAAGMACDGAKPVVAIYSTFLQRAYDQLIHDVAVQHLDVLFAIDRAGLVGEDGPTHAGSFDLSYLRCIPGMLVMTPSDENELRRMLSTGHLFDGPAAVRYPRGSGPNATIEPGLQPLEIGKGIVRRQGRQVALLVFGVQLSEALKVGDSLDATVVDMRCVKPLDEPLVRQLAANHELLVTIEENSIMGGAGSAVGVAALPLPAGGAGRAPARPDSARAIRQTPWPGAPASARVAGPGHRACLPPAAPHLSCAASPRTAFGGERPRDRPGWVEKRNDGIVATETFFVI
jgi:1-deoxy-D-xylulose-5-phosphate synthase